MNSGNYQKLVNDSRETEVATKNAERVITSAQAAIAKAQALIQVHKQKLATAQEKMEELKAAKNQVQQDLTVRSSKLEFLGSTRHKEILI